MKIKKKLKNAEFEYDDETKKFVLLNSERGETIELNKVHAFAFMRFVVRMAQRNWFRQKKLSPSEAKTSLPANDQLEMFDG